MIVVGQFPLSKESAIVALDLHVAESVPDPEIGGVGGILGLFLPFLLALWFRDGALPGRNSPNWRKLSVQLLS